MSGPGSGATGRLAETFRRLREAGNGPGLVTYVTAGDPDLGRTEGILRALDRGGVDVLEVGVPFSDPLADGPVIQRSSERALEHGVSLRDVLSYVAEFRRKDAATPVVLMGYANPIERMGLEVFVKAAREAGVDGVGGYNTHTIAMQIPISQLKGPDGQMIIGIYASASRQKIRILGDDGTFKNKDSWVQVSRLGNPLVNEVLIPLGKKDFWNSQDPSKDAQFLSNYTDPELAALVNLLYPALTDAATSGRSDLVARLRQHAAPAGEGRLDPEPQERQARLDDDVVRHRGGRQDDDRRQHVGHDVADEDRPLASADRPHGFHVLALLHREHLGAHDPGEAGPARDAQHEHDVEQPRADHRKRQIIGRQIFCTVAAPCAEKIASDQSCDTAVQVHNKSAGEVNDARPAEESTAPNPMCNRNVNDQQPE